MKRLAYNELLEWKNKADRKPLIMNGARQVGKTWLLKEFGANEYSNIAYINCDEIDEMKNAFSDFNIERLVRTFSILAGVTIKPGETLIILDEIQQVPIAITALKYFCENAPEYHIAVAGSLLGIGLHDGTGFPMVDKAPLYRYDFGAEEPIVIDDDVYIGSMDSGYDPNLIDNNSFYYLKHEQGEDFDTRTYKWCYYDGSQAKEIVGGIRK